MTRFTRFINFVEVGGGLGLEDLAGMFLSFLSSMSSEIRVRKVRSDFFRSLSRKALSFVPNDHIFNEGVSKIFEFTLSV